MYFGTWSYFEKLNKTSGSLWDIRQSNRPVFSKNVIVIKDKEVGGTVSGDGEEEAPGDSTAGNVWSDIFLGCKGQNWETCKPGEVCG